MQSKNYPTTRLLHREQENWQRKKELFTSVKDMTIVTPSQWLAELARQSFLQSYPVRVIRNGIDLQSFRPTAGDLKKRYDLQNKRIVLGVAASWGPRKGLEEFFALADILGEDYQVVLVGLDAQQLRRLPKNILGIPKTNTAQELAEIYTAADVFVNPGKQETMGMTTVEAMACGTPVVVSPLTAIPEVVTPSSGIIVDHLSADTLAKAVRQTQQQEFQPRQTAQQYDRSLQYGQYLDLYEQMLLKK